MAPLPPNSTPRYKVFYTNNDVQHVQQVRSHASPSTFGTTMDSIWTTIGAQLYETVIDDVQFCADGENVFNSVSTTLTGNTYGSGSGSAGSPATFIGFPGRSSDGRKVELLFFGVKTVGTDYRIIAGENVDVDATVELLQGLTTFIVTIGDLAPVWKTYANAGYNAYWQRKLRP